MDRAHAAHGQQLPPTSCPNMGTVREEHRKKRGEGLWRRREWHWVSTLGWGWIGGSQQVPLGSMISGPVLHTERRNWWWWWWSSRAWSRLVLQTQHINTDFLSDKSSFLLFRPRAHYAGEIWKWRFHSEAHQMFPVHTTPEKFENAVITCHFELCLSKTRARKSRDYRDVIVFKKLGFEKMISVHTKTQSQRFQIPSVWTVFLESSVFDGSVWTVGLSVEIALRFDISPAECRRDLKKLSCSLLTCNIE